MGETEVAFQACQNSECLGYSRSECQWGEWSGWSLCSISCGEGGERKRYRLLTRETEGRPCKGETSEIASCPVYRCPQIKDFQLTESPRRPATTTTTTQTTTTINVQKYLNGPKSLLGKFENPLHGVSGLVYTVGSDKILIEDFSYDGRGPDAFFWVGTEGTPGPKGTVLPHPFVGKFYDYRDLKVPVLKSSSSEDIVLTLPPSLRSEDIKWISVWCRKFAVDFGHVVVRGNQLAEEDDPSKDDQTRDDNIDSSINSVINNITVDLPSISTSKVSSSFSQKFPTKSRNNIFSTKSTSKNPAKSSSKSSPLPTISISSTSTTSNVGESNNNVEDAREVDTDSDNIIITVDLPDLSSIPEQPRSFGRTSGKQSVTYSIGNEFSNGQSKKTKPKEYANDQTSTSKAKAKVKAMNFTPNEEDVDFTVIRVQSSVSQEASIGDNEREESAGDILTHSDNSTSDNTVPKNLDSSDGERTSAVETTTPQSETSDRPFVRTTERNGFHVDKVIEVTLDNIDGVSSLQTIGTEPTPTIGAQFSSMTTTNTGANETNSPAFSTTTPGATTPSGNTTPRPTRTKFFRPPTTEGSSRISNRPSFFKPSQERQRTSLFNRNTSPSALLDEEFNDFFDTSTPKSRRFSIAPRLTTPGTNDQKDETNQLGASFTPKSGRITFRPKILIDINEPVTDRASPSRFTSKSVFTTSDEVRNPSTIGSRQFSFKPRVTTATTSQETVATVKLGKPEINLPVSTIGPRLPPLRTTPQPTPDLEQNTTPQSSTPEASISSTQRQTTIIKLDTTAVTTTETTPKSSSTRRSLFFPSRRPGSFFPRRPSLARSTTVSTPLTTPKLRTRKLKDRINGIFTRRRSTTPQPIESETLIPELSEDGSLIEINSIEPTEAPRARESDDRKLSLFGSEEGDNDDADKDLDLNDEANGIQSSRNKLFGNRRNIFKDKFRPRKPILRKPTTRRPTAKPFKPTAEPAPLTTVAIDADFPPFTTARTTEPPPQTTRKSGSISRRNFNRVTRPFIRTTPLPTSFTTPKRMSEDERFKIFTDFMKKTENMTTLKDTEITTQGLVLQGNDAEDEHTTIFDIPQDDIVETPRSSISTSSKNKIVKIDDDKSKEVDKKSRPHDLTTKWESGKVTELPQKSTDPTVLIKLEDFEDYDDLAKETSTPEVVTLASSSYNPCDIRGTCGPNAKCEPIRNEPTCSCPSGFSEIPRNGKPDPQHGCVRTPLTCKGNSSCVQDHTCVRDVCLQGCDGDTECALGERCITDDDQPDRKVCIKICFYDAHCLAGEYCEENVCRPGCRSDSNCPFGQICGKGPEESTRECEEGCHFSNDCPIGQECKDGTCSDPCAGFTECGTNAECVAINHLPTCRCPEGYKELNSPYDACVVASADLTLLECLEDSDCGGGTCHEGICGTP